MKKFIWKLFQIGVGILLALNVYALALKFIPVPGTALMVQRSLAGEDIRRDWTPLEDISPYIIDAIIAGEDGRFCKHNGIDFDAIKQALEDNQSGKRKRGGSTITQQTAKNVFFWNGGGYVRKAGEAWMASFIDFIWGKRRTIEVYLNVAEWGDGIFGIEAASQIRFGKPAKTLTAQDAALLAAVLPSPNKWRIDPPEDYVRRRAGTLRQRMRVVRDSGYNACVTNRADYPAVRQPVPETVTPKLEATEIEEEPEIETSEIIEEAEPLPPEPEPDVPVREPETPTLSEIDIMEMDTGDKDPEDPEP